MTKTTTKKPTTTKTTAKKTVKAPARKATAVKKTTARSSVKTVATKRTTKSSARSTSKKVDYYPNRVQFYVSVSAAVLILVFTVITLG